MISLGITTYERPEFLERCLAGVIEHLCPIVDDITVHDDGSRSKFHADYAYLQSAMCEPNGIKWWAGSHVGVGQSKNRLLRHGLRKGADWLFLLEDDCCPTSPMAVTGYIKTCQESGLDHLCFAHHGNLNAAPHGVSGPLTIWPNAVGAFTVYSRRCLEAVGLFDEHFHNALEHVEHTARLADAGYAHKWPGCADATGSEAWLSEIPGALEHSAIRKDPAWMDAFDDARRYWKSAKPDTYRLIWP